MRKRRALVGFSSPIGYGYEHHAPTTKHDLQSSPNPFLLGSMGLFLLYDEIWFACESLCPANMRKLPYVNFLDQQFENNVEIANEIAEANNWVQFFRTPNINDAFPSGYGETERIFGEGLKIDNHTHGLAFLDAKLNGNPGIDQLAIDLWLLRRFPELNLELVLNPLTAQAAIEPGEDNSEIFPESRFRQVGITNRLIKLRGFEDINSPEGPYNEGVEKLRSDQTISDFRRWIARETDRWDNWSEEQIEAEVDDKVRDLTETALRGYESRFRLSQVAIDLVKGAIGNVYRIAEFGAARTVASEELAYTFIARSRNS